MVLKIHNGRFARADLGNCKWLLQITSRVLGQIFIYSNVFSILMNVS